MSKRPKSILISGASGFVGSRLQALLTTEERTVWTLVRRGARADHEIQWDPVGGKWDVDRLAAAQPDAVVNLAGANIGGARWTAAYKQTILESRLQATGLLRQMVDSLPTPPSVVVSASAVGYYGSQPSPLDEAGPVGSDFLADVCRQWEAAAADLAGRGSRLTFARFGVVLDPNGGMLQKLTPIFRLGLGGPLGNGQHWMSWVSLEDACRALIWILDHEALTGPVNITAPEAVTNRDFSTIFAATFGRRARLPVPKAALTLVQGRDSEALFFQSIQAQPAALLQAGFAFAHPSLDTALLSA